MTSRVSVEKPPHADADRVRHLSAEAIVAALDPAVGADAAVADPAVGADAAVADPADPAGALLRYLGRADRRRPVPRLAERVAAFTAEERERARAGADAAAAQRRSFTDRGIGRSRLYGFHYLGWTMPLLEQHLLSGEERWLRRWEEIFHRWYDCRDEVRGDWPGLDVIWYTLGVGFRLPLFAHALDAGGDRLARHTRVRLLGSILGGARWLWDEHDSFRPGNWQFAGACTLFCAGVLFPQFREASGWVAAGRARIEEHLAMDVHADGGHSERSPSYHRLCLEQVQLAAQHAERYLGWRLGDDERLIRMYDWLVAMATPEGWLPPFQDSAHVAAGPLLVLGHRLAPKPEYKALAEATVPAEEIAAQLARLPDRDGVSAAACWSAAPAAPPRSRSAWLPDSRYFVSRSGWRPGALYAAVNCGGRVPHELESHSHRACLDFVLWGYGQPLAWEAAGPDSYDDPAYHDWFQAPRAHSTVVFDDREPDLSSGATAEALARHDPIDVLVARHDGWGARHRRTFLAVRPAGTLPGYWVVRDEVAGEGDWRWLLHGRSAWRADRAQRFVSAEAPGLLVHAEGARSAATEVGRTSYPSPDGPRWGDLHTLSLTPRGSTLTAVLVPYRGEPPGLAVSAGDGNRLLLDWGDAVDEIGPHSWTRPGGDGARVSITWATS